MKLKIKAGSTSRTAKIFVQDSSKTDGSGLTGLAFNTGSLTWYYLREGDSSDTSVTIVTATLGTFTSGGFIVVDGTNMPGVYEIGIPNAAIASGAKTVHMMLRGAANMVPVLIEVELDAVDYQDSTAFGLSRVDAAVSSRMATYTQPTGFLAATFPGGTIANTTNITAASGIALAASQHVIVDSGTVTTLTNLPSIPANWITAAGINAGALTSGAFANGAITAASIAAAALNGKGDWLLSTGYTAPTNLTAAQIATGVWQDATAGDFTTAGSIGKSLYTGGNAPGASLGLWISSSLNNRFIDSVTTVTGNVGGSVGSVAAGVTCSSFSGAAVATFPPFFTSLSINSSGQVVVAGFATGAITNAAFGTSSPPDSPTAAKLASMLTASGMNSTFTVDALKNAPSGGGGGSAPNIEVDIKEIRST